MGRGAAHLARHDVPEPQAAPLAAVQEEVMPEPRAFDTISGDEARRMEQRKMTERQFQQWVLNTAHALGWKCYHHDTQLPTRATVDGRVIRTRAMVGKGFPDIVAVRGSQCLMAELKTEKGKLSPEQEAWAEALRDVKGIRYYIWRPHDMDDITEILSEGE